MANQEHVDLLKQGVETWNAWQREHRGIRPDLKGADLHRSNLSEALLSRANLSEADLSGAKLSGARLYEVNLSGARLSEADLSGANLFHADFYGADLSEAKLSGADLFGAKLSGADLFGVDLTNANLISVDLTNVNLDNASVGWTVFGNLDLRTVKGLQTLRHQGPSTIGTSVFECSQGDIPRAFLRGAGLSDTLIDYLPSLFTLPIQYHSLFLSHSHLDQSFTKQLHNSLQDNGVRCWLASHDLRPGTPIVSGIDEAIHRHDKLLLILSEHAMTSHWVQTEVESALYREATTGQDILFPIRLDNTILESETLWARRLRSRHIADFTGWQDDAVYQQAFTTLLRHLKVTKPPIA